MPFPRGCHQTEQTRLKISQGLKERYLQDQQLHVKLSQAHKGKSLSEEHCRKLSEALKGKTRSEEHCRNISAGKKGKSNLFWRGRHHTSETIRKLSNTRKGKHTSPATEFKKGQAHTEEWKRQHSLTMKGHRFTDEHNKKISLAHKGKHLSEETKSKLSLIAQHRWQNPEYALKQMKAQRVKPNKAERAFGQLLQSHGLPYMYVGDGQLIIGGKCPDFTNINGQKKLIELFGRHWHKPEDEEERIGIFSRYGYSTLIIWQEELTDSQKVIEKVRSFERAISSSTH